MDSIEENQYKNGIRQRRKLPLSLLSIYLAIVSYPIETGVEDW